jgi:hypothetical protein
MTPLLLGDEQEFEVSTAEAVLGGNSKAEGSLLVPLERNVSCIYILE